MNKLETLEEYKKLLEKKRYIETELAKQEALLAEAKIARDGFLVGILQKYKVNTIEELVALRDAKIQEATQFITKIKEDCPEVFNR